MNKLEEVVKMLTHLTLNNIKPKTISRIAVFMAILLAPLMTYGSAYLLYSQTDRFQTKQTEAVIEMRVPTKVSLSRADSAQIAANIAIAGI